MEEWHGKKPYVEERNRKKKLQFAKAHISKEFEFFFLEKCEFYRREPIQVIRVRW